MTAPSEPAAFAADSFNRAVTNGLGTAGVGGWTTGSSTNFAVAAGSAALTARTAGVSLSAYLASATSTTSDLRLTLASD